MTKQRWDRIEAVLDEVMPCPPAERAAWLDAHCDADLRTEVEALLEADAHALGFLDAPAAAFAAPLVPEASGAPQELPPDLLADASEKQVGPYRLVREIGRGGMSRVFLAERTDGHFEQQVALKVLRSDLLGETLRQRLRAERQILAQLDHPGIARVFDGGVTDDGRPYLVLEYVDGVPIDEYCERRELSVPERLVLFEQVCAAVQQAHRSLVVHRDLKPSNMLVTEEGRVKLLDFGIAKLLEAAPGYTAPHTQTGERWMTPHYAAPEQVEGAAITTSTDVYTLGVLLYQLLAGRRPFEEQPSHQVARAVLEDDPAPPSQPAATLGTALSTDLDRIVLKALRKEPARRYVSVEALADDVRRFREGRPVEARRATWRYHARKFVQRNRWPVAAALAALLLLAGGGLWHTARVAAERDRAQAAARRAESEAQKAEQVAGFLTRLFEAGNPTNVAGDTLTAYDLLDRGAARLDTLSAQPAVQAEMAALIGGAYAGLGDTEHAQSLLEQAIQLRRSHADDDPAALAEALETLAAFHAANRSFKYAGPLYREALAIRRAQPGKDAPLRTAGTMRKLAGVVSQTQPDSGIVIAREALALLQEHDAPAADIRTAQAQLATVLNQQDRFDEAAALFSQALPQYRAAAAGDSTHLAELAKVLHNFSNARIGQEAFGEAISLSREAVALRQRLNKKAHQSTTIAMRTLAIALSEAGRYDEARDVWKQRLALVQRHLPPDHWRVGNAQSVLGSFDLWRGDPARAEPRLRAAHGVFARRWTSGHPWIEQALFRLGICRALQGRYEEAEKLLARGASGFDMASYYSWNHYDDHLLQLLQDHYEARGQLERVAEYRGLLEEPEEGDAAG